MIKTNQITNQSILNQHQFIVRTLNLKSHRQNEHLQVNNQLLMNMWAHAINNQHLQSFIESFESLNFSSLLIDQLKILLNTVSIIGQHLAIIGIRKIIAAEPPPIEQFIQVGIIQRITQLANQSQYPHIKFEATWILADIFSGTEEQTQFMCQCGVIQTLTRNLLQSENTSIVDKIFCGLANISAENILYRDQIIQKGLGCVNYHMNDPKKSIYILENGIYLISNLLRPQPNPPYESVKQSIQILFNTFMSNTKLANDTLWQILLTLSCYAYETQIYNSLVKQNVLAKIILMLRSSASQENGSFAILTLLTQLANKNPQVFTILVSIDKQFLYLCKQCLSNYNQSIRKGVLKLIACACLGSQNIINLLFKELVINELTLIIIRGFFTERKMALCCLINLLEVRIPNQSIVRLLSPDFSDLSSIVFNALNREETMLTASKMIYQVFLFCHQLREFDSALTSIFLNWKRKWGNCKERIIFVFEESIIEIMLRIQTFLDISANE